MLFCCLRSNVETSCHKHFVIVSCHQQTPLLTTRDKCHNLPLATVQRCHVDNTWWSQRWQDTMKPDTGWKSRFLPTTSAFNVPRWNIATTFGIEKLKWCGYRMVKNFWRYVYSFRQNVRTWQTDGRTDTAWQHRQRLHSIAWQQSSNVHTTYIHTQRTKYLALEAQWSVSLFGFVLCWETKD